MNTKRAVLKNAVIFDLDGVLLDSMPYYCEAWSAAFAAQNIVIDKNEFYEREGEQRIKSVIEIFEKSKGYRPSTRVSEDILNTMRDTFAKSFRPEFFPCKRDCYWAWQERAPP